MGWIKKIKGYVKGYVRQKRQRRKYLKRLERNAYMMQEEKEAWHRGRNKAMRRRPSWITGARQELSWKKRKKRKNIRR